MGLSCRRLVLFALCSLGAGAAAPRPIADEEGPTEPHHVVRSLLDPKISLSYKQTRMCETTPGVKAYSGYVNLPANEAEGRPYDIHTFFWFFEARKNPQYAPLSLWLQGGPGATSSLGVFQENGPCYVNHDSKSTRLNPWSWNNEVNMLYVDQPAETGFSYSSLINGTIDEVSSPFAVTPLLSSSVVNSTTLAGTFAAQNPSTTANTTATAALAAWHFMQVWMQQFPVYKPKDNTFSIWGESYGGHYCPSFAEFFISQSKKIENGAIAGKPAVPLRIDTVGIVNGCIDILTQMPAYPQMAFNNTYGIRIINETQYAAALGHFPGCRSRVENCRSLAVAKDPAGLGNVNEVNLACVDAYDYCFATMYGGVAKGGRDVADIAMMTPDPFPPKYAAGYLNSREIQLDLGVPLNITALAPAVYDLYLEGTGDFVLGKELDTLGILLDQGVKVALMYGDRDYQCNWYGGEQVSLAIQSQLSKGFRAAGYAKIQTNDGYVGGAVRQYGNLSFSRVFDAGHQVPAYQPETAYRIFQRVTSNKDVATGKLSTGKSYCQVYSTRGPDTVANVTNPLPPQYKPECYLWDVLETCTLTQAEMLRNGTAILKDYIMIGHRLADGTVHYY